MSGSITQNDASGSPPLHNKKKCSQFIALLIWWFPPPPPVLEVQEFQFDLKEPQMVPKSLLWHGLKKLCQERDKVASDPHSACF